jgi:fibronectin type 3 domain-containing protein
MALADYFSPTNWQNDTTVPEVLSDMSANISSNVQYTTGSLATAQAYGLPLFSYEGGPGNTNGGANSTTNVGVQILANRDPGMDTLVQTLIRNDWFEEGASMFGYFVLSSAYDRYGDWGMTDDYRNLTTSKYNALVNLTGYEPGGKPFSPGDLIATPGSSSVALAWLTVPGVTSYNVLRGTTSGGETLLTSVSSSASTYTDDSVTNGTTYYYEITGTNSTGTGAPSNEASAEPAASAPPAPTNLTATPGNAQIVLNWTAAAGATSYDIYEGTSSGGESGTPIATGVTTTAYTVTGLTNGTTYYFEVAGVNSVGTGADSNQASATPIAAPAAPTGLAASPGNAQVALSWTGSSGATSYNVYQGTSSGGESGTPVATGITSTTYTVTGLTNGTEYYFEVAAVNSAGTSGYSNQASATPVAASALLAYEPFGESGTTPFALSGASGGGDSGWAAAWDEQSGETAVPGYNIASATPLTYTGLSTTSHYAVGGYEYQTSGRALNVASGGPFNSYLSGGLIGASGQTIWISFMMRVDGNTGDIAAIIPTAQSGSNVWDVNPNNVAVGYFGSLSETGSTGYWSLQENTNQNNLGSATVIKTSVPVVIGTPALLVMSITFGSTNTVNLYVNPTTLGGSAPSTPSATYSTTSSLAFQGLAYYGGIGTGESSLGDLRVGATYAAVTPVSSPPAAPTGLTASPGNAQVGLSWTAATGATSYNVYEGTSSGGESGTPIATGVTSTSYTATGLSNGTTYYFEVAGVNSAGTGPDSNQASATPIAPPAAPTGLGATAGNAQVALAWTASSGATGYNVYQGTSSGGESGTPVATGITSTTYTVTGLTNGTEYFFKVAAVNSSGTSGYSNEANATPTSGGGGTLLAYEPFGESGTTPFALSGASGGGDSGWAAGWDEQSGSTAVPGYNIASTTPLTYTGLTTTSHYAVGGYEYQTSGRALNVASGGPFNSYLSGGLIGASGQTIWISFLMRVDGNTGDIAAVMPTAQSGSNVWDVNPNNVAVGYFGSLSETGSTGYWSLQENTNQNNLGSATVVKTSVPVVVGTPALLVMSITFGSTNTVNLYVNPTTLGGSAPSTPSATYSTTSSLAFQGLAYYAGNSTGESSLGDIRVGTTYAAVTP